MSEHTNGVCVLCSGQTHHPFFKEHGYQVVRCDSCRLLYVHPRPTEAELQAMYDEEVFYTAEGEVSRDDQHYESGETGHQLIARKTAERLLKYTQASGGRLLDIGCGLGHFVEAAQNLGFATEGVELSGSRVEAARARGLTVHHGEAVDLDLPAGGYDVVTSVNVLSHHPAPVALVKQMASLTKPGGIVFLQTGNKADLQTYKDGTALSDYWGPPEHLFWFGEEQLQLLMAQAGLKVIGVERLPYLDATLSTERLMKPGRGNAVKKLFLWVPPLKHLFKAAYRWYFYRGRPESSALYVFARREQ